jgi:gas vesicle protein
MKSASQYSHQTSAALLDALGLQTKSNSSRALAFAGVAVGGIVVGAVAALLLTPRTGRQLRADLRSGARELGDTAAFKASQAMDGARHAVDSIEHSYRNSDHHNGATRG